MILVTLCQHLVACLNASLILSADRCGRGWPLTPATLPGVSGLLITAFALSTVKDGVCAGNQSSETGAAHITVAPTITPSTLSFSSLVFERIFLFF
jgi:hypothetical protein